MTEILFRAFCFSVPLSVKCNDEIYFTELLLVSKL